MKWRYKPTRSKRSAEETFEAIYRANVWGNEESVSGQGSSVASTTQIVSGIQLLLTEKNVTSLVDCPCGDFNWIQNLNLTGIHYVGIDIVPEIIASNNARYATGGVQFKVGNLIVDSLETADLILVRDCFVHFSYEDIQSALEQIKKSGSTYLLTTTFTKLHVNHDIVSGEWRRINLCRKPFNFPKPQLLIEENTVSGYVKYYRGKSLALWKISDLP